MNNVITVTFDGQVLKPEIPLFLAQNKKYKIVIIPDENPSENQQNAWDILEDMAGTYEGSQDWSSEHNHYLYGTEKQYITDD